MRRPKRPIGPLLPVAAAVLAVISAGAQEPDSAPLITRVGAYVEQYYARAQSLLALEAVTIQPLGRDLSWDGFARRLEYELRLEWTPDADDGGTPARVVRELVSVNGRPPRPGDEPRCTDPRGVSPEPLALLLPAHRDSYIFHPAGTAVVNGRRAAVFDYRSVAAESPRVEWDEDCAHIDLPGRTRGRVWADPVTAEILRFDEQLVGMVDIPVPLAQQRRGAAPFMTVERADMSIEYRPVVFEAPDETLMLPARIENLVIVRNSGSPRLRITQAFSNYRRFVTDSRIVR